MVKAMAKKNPQQLDPSVLTDQPKLMVTASNWRQASTRNRLKRHLQHLPKEHSMVETSPGSTRRSTWCPTAPSFASLACCRFPFECQASGRAKHRENHWLLRWKTKKNHRTWAIFWGQSQCHDLFVWLCTYYMYLQIWCEENTLPISKIFELFWCLYHPGAWHVGCHDPWHWKDWPSHQQNDSWVFLSGQDPKRCTNGPMSEKLPGPNMNLLEDRTDRRDTSWHSVGPID